MAVPGRPGRHRSRELVALRSRTDALVRLTGHEAASVSRVAQPEPDVRASRGGSLGDHARDPWQDVLARVGLADALAEAGEHLVRRRPVAVHQSVREPVRAVAHRLERDRDQRRRRDPQDQRVGEERSETHHDRDVDRGDERGEHAEHHRLADHEVDVVIQPVLQDRDPIAIGDCIRTRP